MRLTASSDPASFPSGLDMTTARGVPWCIPLPAIAGHKTFASVRHILTAVDATVSQQMMDLAREHRHKFQSGDVMGTRYLHAFGQPFDLPLDANLVSFAIVGKDRVAHATLREISSFYTWNLQQRYHPFAGQPVARAAPFYNCAPRAS